MKTLLKAMSIIIALELINLISKPRCFKLANWLTKIITETRKDGICILRGTYSDHISISYRKNGHHLVLYTIDVFGGCYKSYYLNKRHYCSAIAKDGVIKVIW